MDSFSTEKDFRKSIAGTGLTSRSVDKLAKALASGAGIITTDLMTVSANQIKTLHTDPILVIPAPGPGKYIVVLDSFFGFHYVAPAYATGDTSLSFHFTSADDGRIAFDSTLLNLVAAESSYAAYLIAEAYVLSENAPVLFCNAGEGYTDGNGTVSFQLRYKIVSL